MGRAAEVNEVLVEGFNICNKKKSSFITPILSLVFSFLVLFFAMWLYLAVFRTNLSLIGLVVLVLMITVFIRTFFSVLNSWIVANIVWEEKVDYFEGLKRTFKMTNQIIAYSVIALIVGLISQSLKRHKKNFLASAIKNSFEGVSEDMWELTTQLSLPSMAVTKNKFSVALQEVKNGMSYISGIKIKDLGIESFTYPLVFIALLVSGFLGWQYFIELGVLVFMCIILMIFLVQSLIKSTYYTVLYIWMGEQIQRKKKKKTLETRVPAILENNITVSLE